MSSPVVVYSNDPTSTSSFPFSPPVRHTLLAFLLPTDNKRYIPISLTKTSRSWRTEEVEVPVVSTRALVTAGAPARNSAFWKVACVMRRNYYSSLYSSIELCDVI